MIRALVLVIGLTLGLSLAVVVEGRMVHLRALAGDRLPDWTHLIADDAALLRGTAAPAPERLMLSASWRLARIGGAGPVWRIQLSGPGARLDGDAVLGVDGVPVLQQLSGRVELAALAIWEQPPAFDADLQIIRASATLNPALGTLATLAVEGFAAGVTLDQSAFGDGRWNASLEPDGRWQIRLSLAAGQAEVEADGDALGGIMRVYVQSGLEDLLPPGWGRPIPAANDRVSVSHLLPIRQQVAH